MMKKLMEFAQGKIVMALEGGYNLDSLVNSALACVKVLLEDEPVVGTSEAYPFESWTWRVIQKVRQELSPFWPILADELPKTIKKATPIQIPDCWMNWQPLNVLNLGYNNLSGNLPKSLGSLTELQSLHLRNNRLTGELPSSLQNCTELLFINIGQNEFFGPFT
ncbi:PREDICTED: histone deacetylase 5-like [Nelumbo nucifera]|uniref:Histone deacetylase 5-like n=1 Tax=Nelumbo nucifera TaxID=4432 RepID=A0A1U8QCX0_NELNU|nr:PREDICTED: histone deacetylase 5-like [Nelumbo nucifera]